MGEGLPGEPGEGGGARGLPQGTVTFVFTDLEGSTRRWEEHPAQMRDALARHDAIVREAIESYGGLVFSTMGDGMAAVFASAREAVRAVLAAQQELAAEPWGEGIGPLAVRMGLLTGEGVLGGEHYLNQPLNRCARLMAAGHGGQTLVSGPQAPGPPGSAEDSRAAGSPDGYAFGQWRQLAERCLRDRQTIILESSFLQNSVMPAFIDGAPVHTVKEIFTTIRLQAAPVEPLLVYLRPADIGAAIARIHRTRGQPWSSRNVAFVENSPWARRRNLHGHDAVVKLYQAWESIVTQLYSQYPFPKIMVTDPQHDWHMTLTRICATVRPSPARRETRT